MMGQNVGVQKSVFLAAQLGAQWQEGGIYLYLKYFKIYKNLEHKSESGPENAR